MRELAYNELDYVTGGTEASGGGDSGSDGSEEIVSVSIVGTLGNWLATMGGIYGGIQAIGGVYYAGRAGVNAYLNWRDGI